MHPDNASSVGLETGNLVSTDCYNVTNGNSGCVVADSSTNSYGAPFASNGGGVFATLWTDDGISIWFFERGNIPADVPTDSPDPSGWGTPAAFYPSSTCDMQTYFAPQNLVIVRHLFFQHPSTVLIIFMQDIDICGSLALAEFNQTCSGNCEDLFLDPSNYDDAYFELSYVRVFTKCVHCLLLSTFKRVKIAFLAVLLMGRRPKMLLPRRRLEVIQWGQPAVAQTPMELSRAFEHA